jgi:hypothetical protein
VISPGQGEPQRANDSRDGGDVSEHRSHPAPKSRVVIAALSFPVVPPRVFRLFVGVNDVDHDRDRALAMSCESVTSGAIHSQFPIIAGMSAIQATSIHKSGLSMVRISPAIATVATHAANTRSFR